MYDLSAPNVKFHIMVLTNALNVLEERLQGPEAKNPSEYLQLEAVLALSECKEALAAVQDAINHQANLSMSLETPRKRA